MRSFKKNIVLRGNVSIMVILILLACSLMGILTIIFLNSLISYTDDTYSYYKSYYVAKAGLELSLTEIDNSQVGFSQIIYPESEINTNNFECVDCHFVSEIQGRYPIISNYFWQSNVCDLQNALSLDAGESMVIPMFYDNTTDFLKILSDDFVPFLLSNYRDDLKLNVVGLNHASLNIGVIFQSGSIDGDVSWEYLYMKSINAGMDFFTRYFHDFDSYYGGVWNNNYFPYIIISNPHEYAVHFCVFIGDDQDKTYSLPTTKYYITSRGEYMGKTVGLQAVYMQPVPSFLINLYNY